METRIHTVVIGAGQAGLAASWHLTRRDIEHVVLERDRIGESWRSKRWDSFTLVTPAWTLKLPGFPYQGDGDRFLSRDEVVQYLEDYADSFGAPVRLAVEVEGVRRRNDGRFEVATEHGTYVADNLVAAVGTYQRPRVPQVSTRIDPAIMQLHASAYRNPDRLRPGGVLVVGGGQSGAQIADELNAAGRDVYLSVARSTRAPRRYRGRDLFAWVQDLGLLDRTVDQLEDPAERFVANPITSGKGGGKNLGLHELARDGVTLLGRLEDADGSVVRCSENLRATLEGSDRFVAEIREGIEEFVAAKRLDLPEATEDEVPGLDHGYAAPDVRELDLRDAGVASIVWATGYSFDFSWLDGAELDDAGYPVTERGVTGVPGLYFVGLHWLHTGKSALFFGVGEDAGHVVEHLAARREADVSA